MEPLNLPKLPTEPHVTERERRDAPQETALLAAVAQRLKPAGTKPLGSIATHIYQNELNGEYIIMAQCAGLKQVDERVALFALKELGRTIMQQYGHKPPAKRDEVMERDV